MPRSFMYGLGHFSYQWEQKAVNSQLALIKISAVSSCALCKETNS